MEYNFYLEELTHLLIIQAWVWRTFWKWRKGACSTSRKTIDSVAKNKIQEFKQEIAGVTAKFGLGVQNEAGQRLTIFSREYTGHSTHPFPTAQETTMCGHHQMVNTEIRLIIFFAVGTGEALYSRQKEDLERTVAQTMSSLL